MAKTRRRKIADFCRLRMEVFLPKHFCPLRFYFTETRKNCVSPEEKNKARVESFFHFVNLMSWSLPVASFPLNRCTSLFFSTFFFSTKIKITNQMSFFCLLLFCQNKTKFRFFLLLFECVGCRFSTDLIPWFCDNWNFVVSAFKNLFLSTRFAPVMQ